MITKWEPRVSYTFLQFQIFPQSNTQEFIPTLLKIKKKKLSSWKTLELIKQNILRIIRKMQQVLSCKPTEAVIRRSYESC